jgi:hypothetical protein
MVRDKILYSRCWEQFKYSEPRVIKQSKNFFKTELQEQGATRIRERDIINRPTGEGSANYTFNYMGETFLFSISFHPFGHHGERQIVQRTNKEGWFIFKKNVTVYYLHWEIVFQIKKADINEKIPREVVDDLQHVQDLTDSQATQLGFLWNIVVEHKIDTKDPEELNRPKFMGPILEEAFQQNLGPFTVTGQKGIQAFFESWNLTQRKD